MITWIDESGTLTKQKSYECKCRFDGKKFSSDKCWNKDKCWCECKKHQYVKKIIFGNPSTCSCENGKYLASIMDDSAIMCDEIIDAEAKLNDEETKTIPTNFNGKKYVL